MGGTPNTQNIEILTKDNFWILTKDNYLKYNSAEEKC
jgi:hypothetical protein